MEVLQNFVQVLNKFANSGEILENLFCVLTKIFGVRTVLSQQLALNIYGYYYTFAILYLIITIVDFNSEKKEKIAYDNSSFDSHVDLLIYPYLHFWFL